MKLAICLLSSLAMAALVAVGAARGADNRPSAPVVGEWGDPARIEFIGLRTFPSNDVRSALLMAPGFILASHPAAPRAEYAPALEKLLRAGFLDAGFPDARVAVALDAETERVRVTLTEGSRYRAGEVKVTGAKTVPVAELVRRLTEAWPPDDLSLLLSSLGNSMQKDDGQRYLNSAGEEVKRVEAVWTRGDPVSFHLSSLHRLSQRVTNVLAEFGYFFPLVNIRVAPRVGQGVADLAIEVRAEGPHGTLGQIEVRGLKKNSREALLKWLHLAPGQPIPYDLVTRIERQLWDSGRFLNYRVTPEQMAEATNRIKLDLLLTEYEPAPLVGRKFSPAEEVCLKFRDWVLSAPRRGEALVMSADATEFPLASFLGPLAGTTFQVVVSGQGAIFRSHDRVQTGYAFVGATNHAGLYSLTRQRKWISDVSNSQLVISLSVTPNAEPEPGSSNLFDFSVGAGFAKNEDSAGAPIRLQMLLAPAAFLSLIHGPDRKFKLEKGFLVMDGEGGHIKIDAKTGRPVEFLYSGTNDIKHPLGRLTYEAGAFARVRREIESASASVPNLCESNRIIGSFAGFLASELIESTILTNLFPKMFLNASPGSRARAASVVGRLLAQGPFDPIDQGLDSSAVKPGESFFIPLDEATSGSGAMSGVMAWVSALAFKLSHQLLPARSWPWTLARESVLIYGGNSKYADSEFRRIYDSTQTGPIGFLAAASLLNQIKSPAAAAFAARGLERLSTADFRKDCRLALATTSGLQTGFLKMAGAVRDLKPDDIAALASVLPAEFAALAGRAAARLREQKDSPPAEMLLPLLEEYWEKNLRAQVEVALRRAGNQAGAMGASEQDYQEGLKHYQPGGLAHNPAEAAKWFLMAAQQGHPLAQHLLGMMHDGGEGVPKDAQTSLRWYSLAASNGVVNAQMALGNIYDNGSAGLEDPAESFFWYSLAAINGEKVAEIFSRNAGRRLSPEQREQILKRVVAAINIKPPAPGKSAP